MNGRPEPQQSQDPATLPRDCAFAREQIEGFVLDALDRFERGIVEQHLRWCRACQTEVAAFERVADRLPYALPLVSDLEPRPETRSALFERIRTEPAPVPANDHARPVAAPVRRPSTNPAPRLASASSSSRWRFVPAAVIAPLAIALVVMGVWANSLRNDLDEREIELASQAELDQALANGGKVALYSVEKEASCPSCHGSGQLGMSESNDMGMVLGWNFDPGKRHDVWGVSTDGQKTKMCELEVDATGDVMQMFTFPEGSGSVTEVYITDEHGDMTYVSHLTPGEDATPVSQSSPSPQVS